MADTASESALAKVDLSTLGLGLAGLTVAGALGVGLFAGVATAMLVLVTGALLGSILLVWHSLRTLAGDADVEPGFDAGTRGPGSALVERKRRALRALKDIEQDHAVGKIDAADFKSLDAEYRERAKVVIREMDDALEPWREKAETLVRTHLEKRAAERALEEKDELEQKDDEARTACPSCETSNDADATFCKKCGTKLSSDA